MKLSLPSRLLREALTDAPSGEYIDKLLEKINADAEQTNQALMQNLTFGENMNAAIVKYDLVHGAEKKIPNPLKTRPIGIKAIRTMAINGGTRYAIDSFDWRFVDSGDPKQPQQIGVTANYAAPPGFVDLRRSSTQSLTSAAITPIQYNVNETGITAVGTTITSGAFTFDITTTSGSPPVNSRINCTAPGFVDVFAMTPFDTSGAALKFAWVGKNNVSGTRWGVGGATVTGFCLPCHSTRLSVVAGDYLQVFAFQDSGGAVNILADGSDYARFQARYVAPPITAQNTVTLLVIGG